MNIIYLILAGLFEVAMVFFLKKSDGFIQKTWSIFFVITATCSLLFLSLAMKTLEAGVAYSIWVAFGSIGSLLLGTFLFNEKIKPLQILFMALIIISVI